MELNYFASGNSFKFHKLQLNVYDTNTMLWKSDLIRLYLVRADAPLRWAHPMRAVGSVFHLFPLKHLIWFCMKSHYLKTIWSSFLILTLNFRTWNSFLMNLSDHLPLFTWKSYLITYRYYFWIINSATKWKVF